MNNQVYYIKPTAGKFAEIITAAFVKALHLSQETGITNMKLVVSHSDVLDENGLLKDGLKLIFENEAEQIVRKLRIERLFSIDNFPDCKHFLF